MILSPKQKGVSKMNSLKQINGSYIFSNEIEYCMDFGLLGFNDWTDINDEGLTWGVQHEEDGCEILIFLYYDNCYGIHLAEDCVPIDEIFGTDSMDELWSIVRSNLEYFDKILIGSK